MPEIWIRVGMTVEVSKEEYMEMKDGEDGFAADEDEVEKNVSNIVEKAIKEGRAKIDDSEPFIPESVVEGLGLGDREILFGLPVIPIAMREAK